MSSVSSFVCLTSNDDHNEDSEWSHLSNANIDTQHEESSIRKSSISVNNVIINPVNDDAENGDDDKRDMDDRFHLSWAENTNTTPTGWSSVNERDFDVESLHSVGEISSIASADTVKANFRFSDYNFYRKRNINGEQKGPKWIWINQGRRKKSRRKRGKRQSLEPSSLCIIDENCEIEKEIDDQGQIIDPNKQIIDIKDLNEFINDTIQINEDITQLIKLCNKITKEGILKANQLEIELHEMPLLGLKLRDIFFRKLILITSNRQIEKDYHDLYEFKYSLRRKIWLQLNWNSRVFLCPFGSFEEFRTLYNVHNSVKCTEFLAVIDNECFAILMKPEWCRVVLFKSYIFKIRSLHWLKRQEIEMTNREQMKEINSLLNIGYFNQSEKQNRYRFQHEQLSLILSDNYTQNESECTDSIQAFDALEREIDARLHAEHELMERWTSTSYES